MKKTIICTGLLGFAVLTGCSDDDEGVTGGGGGAASGGSSSSDGSGGERADSGSGGHSGDEDSATGGSDGDTTPPDEILAEGVYELTAFRTGDCDGLEDQDLPFAYFVIEYSESSEGFLVSSCETAEDCSSASQVEDNFNVPLAEAGDDPVRSLASSVSYDSNGEACELLVAEEHLLDASETGVVWTFNDYRGNAVVDIDEFDCGYVEFDIGSYLNELDDCPNTDEWEGTRVE